MKFLIIILSFSLNQNIFAETKEFDAKNIKKIEIESPKGEIKVTTSSSSKIKVDVNKLKFDPKCRMAFTEEGSTLKIIIDQENMIFDKANCVTKVTVNSSKNVDLKITTGTADTKVDGVEGEIDFKSATGKFEGGGLQNNFSATTATGHIALKYAQCNKRADVEILTASSDTELKLPSHCKIKVSHKSAAGDLFNEIGESNDYNLMIKVRSASGSLKILKEK